MKLFIFILFIITAHPVLAQTQPGEWLQPMLTCYGNSEDGTQYAITVQKRWTNSGPVKEAGDEFFVPTRFLVNVQRDGKQIFEAKDVLFIEAGGRCPFVKYANDYIGGSNTFALKRLSRFERPRAWEFNLYHQRNGIDTYNLPVKCKHPSAW